MSAILDCALELAQQKVRFFPVRPNSKLPAVANFSAKATSDPEQLTEMFDGHHNYNSGIACGRVAEGLYLVGFDIDNKDGRNGYETLELMAELGEEFPETWAQKTPSGGEHRLFWSPVPVRQGTDVCGKGIDFRGDGGYLVGPGSTIGGVPYSVLRHLHIAKFPSWAIAKWEKKATVHSIGKATKGVPVDNQILALRQAVEYLAALPVVHEGSRSDACFKVCAQMRDYGVDQSQMLDVLVAHWKCEPMLSDEEMIFTISNAFKYTKGEAGKSAPEKLFSPVVDIMEKTPVERMNENHFFCAANGGAHVYWETERAGKFHLERFPIYNFHLKYLSEKMKHNGREAKTSQVWLEAKERREYECLRFDPGNQLSINEYNTWRGFAVKRHDMAIGLDQRAIDGVQLFLEHCRENICGGDKKLSDWLITFMAHIFQKPEEKPGVSLVFQGKKGTGKTIISEILDHLIGDNSVILADKAHVLGHFNALMEDKILVTLDEAFWSGDKSVEGVLKDLITGHTRVITHKGTNSYTARVFDRVIIIGNEKWLVPASMDERRFAVFSVGEKRRQDRKFFGAMKDGLFRHGGAAFLMEYFMNWDLNAVDINFAPDTEGLTAQKKLSLSQFEQWWFDCLLEGELLGSGLHLWPDEIRVHDFYESYLNQLGHRAYKPNSISIGMTFKTLSKKCGGSKAVNGIRKYYFCSLEDARKEWDEHCGFKTNWEE